MERNSEQQRLHLLQQHQRDQDECDLLLKLLLHPRSMEYNSRPLSWQQQQAVDIDDIDYDGYCYEQPPPPVMMMMMMTNALLPIVEEEPAHGVVQLLLPRAVQPLPY